MVNYIAKINNSPIGGNQFDGAVEVKNVWFITETSLAVNASKTMDISSYIPNDGYQYEILLIAYCSSGSTKNGLCDMRIAQGSSASTNNQTRIAARSTSSGASRRNHKVFPFIITATGARSITVKNAGDASGSIRLGMVNKRRIGTNANLSDYVEKAATPAGAVNFGGEVNDGVPVATNTTILSTTSIAANGTKTLSLSSYLPNDGYNYEVCLFGWGSTGSTSGNSATFFVNGGSLTPWTYLGGAVTRFSSSELFAGDSNMVVGTNRNLIVQNTGNAAANMTISLRSYKRMAKPATGNNISTINGHAVGGGTFSGQWVFKGANILNKVTYSDSSTVTRTYTVNNYLPDNTYRYEILFNIAGATANTSGKIINITVSSNITTGQGVYAVSRENYGNYDGNTFKKIASQVNGVLTIKTTSYSSVTGNIYFNLLGYRRIGTAGNL